MAKKDKKDEKPTITQDPAQTEKTQAQKDATAATEKKDLNDFYAKRKKK